MSGGLTVAGAAVGVMGLPIFMHAYFGRMRVRHSRSIVEAPLKHVEAQSKHGQTTTFDTSLEVGGYRPALKENAFQTPAVTRLRMSRLESSRWSNLCVRISTETARLVPSSEYCGFQACLLHAYHILVRNQFLGLHGAIARHDGIIIYKIAHCN